MKISTPSPLQQHLLVLRFSALGDVAMTLPVIYSVAEAYPEAKITVVTRPFFSRLFINAPANIDVVAFEPRDYRGLSGRRRMLKELSSLRPTAVADLHNVGRTWFIDGWMRLHGVKVAKVDKMRRSRRQVLHKGLVQPNYIDRYQSVFAKLGFEAPLTFTSLFATIPAQSPAAVTHPAVGVAPFARYDNKMYPPQMMRRVVSALAARGVNVYLFGGRGHEAKEMEWWAREIDGCHSVAGRFDLAGELAMMSKMNLMISMDSANQHLASLVATPVLTLWGSTTPACGFTAYRQRSEGQMVASIECQPCTIAGSTKCRRGDMACMRSLTVEMIVEKVMQMLHSESSGTDA